MVFDVMTTIRISRSTKQHLDGLMVAGKFKSYAEMMEWFVSGSDDFVMERVMEKRMLSGDRDGASDGSADKNGKV